MFRLRILLLISFLTLGAATMPVFSQDSESRKAKRERKREEKEKLKKEKRERKKGKSSETPAAELTEKEKEVSTALFLDGVRNAMLEDYPKALEFFQQAYKMNPKNAASNVKIAEVYLNIR